jgi:hypothetical protein
MVAIDHIESRCNTVWIDSMMKAMAMKKFAEFVQIRCR